MGKNWRLWQIWLSEWSFSNKTRKSDRMQNTLSRVDLRTWYLTFHISWHGILDNKKHGKLVWIDGGTKPKHSPVFQKLISRRWKNRYRGDEKNRYCVYEKIDIAAKEKSAVAESSYRTLEHHLRGEQKRKLCLLPRPYRQTQIHKKHKKHNSASYVFNCLSTKSVQAKKLPGHFQKT